jgi:hypothetical protein
MHVKMRIEKVEPLYGSLSKVMAALFSSYSQAELAFDHELIGQFIPIIRTGRKMRLQQTSTSRYRLAEPVGQHFPFDLSDQVMDDLIPLLGLDPSRDTTVREDLHPSFEQRHENQNTGAIPRRIQPLRMKTPEGAAMHMLQNFVAYQE